MNKEKYNQMINQAYENWCKQFEVDPNNFNVDELVKGHGDQCWGYPLLENTSKEYKRGQINAYLEGKAEKPFFYLTKEQYINKCKTDTEFSKKWELQIEEKMLTYPERYRIWFQNNFETGMECCLEIAPEFGDEYYEPTPTKLIKITYNNEKIEVYE